MNQRNRHILEMTRPAVVRGILLAIAAAFMIGAVSLYVTQAAAGAPTQVVVNSLANDHAGGDTGNCDTTPGSGTCTLGQAINYANDGMADEIVFHPPVFPKASPGVIFIDDTLSDNDGCLPPIEVPLVINSTDTGVIIDGDEGDDGAPVECEAGLKVVPSGNGFDFTLNGGKNFTIRDIGDDNDRFDGNGILLDGDDNSPAGCPFGYCSFGDVDINGVIIRNVGQDGIRIRDTVNVTDVSITNNDIRATYDPDCLACNDDGDDAIDIYVNSDNGNVDLVNNMVDISGNTLLGADEGVFVFFDGDLDGKITVSVDENVSITGLGEDAVGIMYSDWDAGGSAFNISVSDNSKILGEVDGVQITIRPDAVPADGGATDVDIQVNGNGRVDADGDDAIDVYIDVCCSNSNSTSTVSVSDNADLIGDEDGVDIDAYLCCGDGNDGVVMVNDNVRIEGQDDDGVDINVNIGDTNDNNASGIFDSDDNTSLVQVNGNGNIDGGDGDGLEIDVDLGSYTGDADDNTSEIEVIGNGPIDGNSAGIDMDTLEVGSDEGDSADDNSLKITITDNASIDGDDEEGINIHTHVGVFDAEDDGDDNSTEIIIENNGPIEGGDGDGIYVDSFTGGDIPGSGGNSNSIRIVQNDEIIGQSTGGGDGIDIGFVVCCDPANTNNITISDNKGDIVGLDDDGIDIYLCCSVNTTTITDNQGTIRGNDGNGIEYEAAMSYPDCSTCDPDGPIANSVNILMISGNTISNSERDGINIGAGAFEKDGVGKSVIANNVIDHNSDEGIEIWCTIGLNIGPGNQIFSNGDDPSADAGVEISASGCDQKLGVMGNSNTVTQNMIWGNAGLGIDLTDTGTGHGVGCDFTGGAVQPNDCIPFPDLVTQAGDKLVGTACSDCDIEVFWVNNTPSDNSGHGEGAEYIMTGTADALGDFSFDLPCDLGAGDLTATATDKLKNTSEFAENLPTFGTSACATPTPTVTDTPVATDTPVPPTATPEPAKVCGDVNGDGSVNSIDASLIFQLKAGFLSSLDNASSADVNNDGSITSVDGALILQVGAGFITEAALTCP